jgi:hypothetical protein
MSSSNLVRLGGPAAVLSGALFIMVFALTIMIYGLKVVGGAILESHAFIHMLDAPMYALLAVGVLGLYLRQIDRLGWLGKTGFYLTGGFALATLGGLAIIVVGLSVGEEATLGVLDAVAHPLSTLIYVVGSVLFGIATFRERILPRWGALLLVIGAPLWFVGPAFFFGALIDGSEDWLLAVPAMVPAVLFGGGWAWLGYTLWSERPSSAATPEGELSYR